MITSEIAPAVPAKNLRRAMVKPLVSTGRQPKAVSIAVVPQLPFGSKALTGEKREKLYKAISSGTIKRCVRIEVWFLPGKRCFIAYLFW